MKPIVSILMSIYNENEQYIRDSVSSILSQSIKNIELVIIVDNPSRSDVLTILKSFNDDRIIFHINNENVGLALSMNKAAKIAKADIFARMDADDIAVPYRLERELMFLTSNIDFVFSGYSKIDAKGNAINGSETVITSLQNHSKISNMISLRPSLIHHPTVLFRRKIFETVGGYRNFPCAQDGDLWMRMAEAGSRFAYVPEVLLKYRINPQSTTSSKGYMQQLTVLYIYKLSVERLISGKDSFSTKHYNDYIKYYTLKNVIKREKLMDSRIYLKKAQNANIFSSIYFKLKSFCKCNLLRKYYFHYVVKNMILKSKHSH